MKGKRASFGHGQIWDRKHLNPIQQKIKWENLCSPMEEKRAKYFTTRAFLESWMSIHSDTARCFECNVLFVRLLKTLHPNYRHNILKTTANFLPIFCAFFLQLKHIQTTIFSLKRKNLRNKSKSEVKILKNDVPEVLYVLYKQWWAILTCFCQKFNTFAIQSSTYGGGSLPKLSISLHHIELIAAD